MGLSPSEGSGSAFTHFIATVNSNLSFETQVSGLVPVQRRNLIQKSKGNVYSGTLAET